MLLQRLLTVVFAAPFLIGAIVCPLPWVFKAVVAVCIGGGLFEFFTIVGFSKGERLFAILLGLIHTLYLLFCPAAARYLLPEIGLLLLSVFGFYCILPRGLAGLAPRIALTLLGVLYVGTFGAVVGMTRDLPDGIFRVFILLAMTWFNDTAAYFFGHHVGRRRLAPHLSPGKTIEGFLGGFVGSLVGFLLFWFLFGRPVSLSHGVVLVILSGLFGPLGDLSESLVKRSYGVKDSGNVIPGHGGMLDRIDALLFNAPVFYFLAQSAW